MFGTLTTAGDETVTAVMTPEEFMEWLEDFEPSVNDDKAPLSGSRNSEVAGSGIVK
jgi:hypothetical protein